MTKLNSNNFLQNCKPNLNLVLKILGVSLLAGGQTFIASNATAGTALTTKETFSGKVNYAVTGGTLRSNPDSIDACSLQSTSTAQLSGIPSGATVKKAYLYWSGSGSTVDDRVTLDNASIIADRNYTDNYSTPKYTYSRSRGRWVRDGDYNLNFFQGVKDVTNQVTNKGNGNYEFKNLNVDNTGDQCALQGTLSAWSLIVIYEDPSIPRDRLNTIKMYEGFKVSRNESVNYTLDGIKVAENPVAKFSMLLWEGDESLGGDNEFFKFNTNILSDDYNPSNNQFNSSINTLRSTSTYGIDLDTFDVSDYVREGDTSITGTISTNNDLVLQGAALVMVTDELANESPSAQPDTITTDEDNSTTYNLIAGDPDRDNAGRDSDPEGDTLYVTKFNLNGTEYTLDTTTSSRTVTMLSGAELTVNRNGDIEYDPNGQFEALNAGESASTPDRFSYTVADYEGSTSTATATVNVNGAADDPVAQDDTATTDEDTAVDINVLANDTDPNGSTLRVTKINNVPLSLDTPVLLTGDESTGASISFKR